MEQPVVTASRSRWIAAVAAVALGLLATWDSASKSLWIDEAYSEYTSRLPVLAAADRALHYELQGPLYFSLLSLWRAVDHSVMWGRALSTLAAIGFVLVMAAVARRAGVSRWWWAAVAAALLPGVVWAASELRNYALTLLLSALTLYFWLGIVSDRPRIARRDAIGYVLSAVALLYSFYYGGFILAGEWVAAMVARRRIPTVTALLALVGVALVPLVPVILWQIHLHPIDTHGVAAASPPRHALFQTAGAVLGVFEGRGDLLGWPHVIPIVAAIAVGIPLLRTVRPSQPWDGREAALAAGAFVPLGILATLRLLNVVPVHAQHFLVTLPGLLLIYVLWIQRVDAGWPRAITGAVVLAGVLACLVSFQRYDVQREDWRGAAQYVAAHAAPGDAVLVYDPDRTLPFGDYFTPLSRGVPFHGVPTDIDLDRYDPFQHAIRDTTVVAARLASLGIAGRPLWFVTATRLVEQVRGSPEMVLAYLTAHDRLDPTVRFAGVSVTHVQPR